MSGGMSFELTEDQELIRKSVRELAARFDDQYWMEKDQAHEFPQEFYDAVASGGWLGMTIPEEYGGHGLGITEATILAEEVARSGGGMNAASAIHMSIFGMQPVVVYGSDELKARTLPRIVNGDLHVCFGVTEPGAGLDTSRITTLWVTRTVPSSVTLSRASRARWRTWLLDSPPGKAGSSPRAHPAASAGWRAEASPAVSPSQSP